MPKRNSLLAPDPPQQMLLYSLKLRDLSSSAIVIMEVCVWILQVGCVRLKGNSDLQR